MARRTGGPVYREIVFRDYWHAAWAAFFDLAGWSWTYHQAGGLEVDTRKYLPDEASRTWSVDFTVSFPCSHSECERTRGSRDGTHELYVEVQPYRTVQTFRDQHRLVSRLVDESSWVEPAPAMFGVTPAATGWQMSHGNGGGYYDVPCWVDNWRELWEEARNLTS
jgi:hypothetical protein